MNYSYITLIEVFVAFLFYEMNLFLNLITSTTTTPRCGRP